MGRRRVAAWLLSFPLMVVGSEVAHALAFQWVYPQARLRLSALLASGHGYMGSSAYLPMLLGLVFATELVGAAWVFAGSVRRRRHQPVPASAFALLPVLSFTLQEFVERWLSGSPTPWLIVLAPTFGAGLLLQLPFALIAYLVARLLLRVVERAARILPVAGWRPVMAGVSLRRPVPGPRSPRRRDLSGGHSGRGPPAAPRQLPGRWAGACVA
jgi:hypothetical protein